ncbi:hypothetical protein QR680_009582 [Steinernema hermaphroditum]|uniref:[heparan sulfate]-glucosamine N-sulfotransferase n=1 Tax=Steinernema hermaphroditum TaxID=289476 RepID=A0AA39IKW5_9BILA|nr:hypothetical protein QR680_009582 [Steinernema hermaphroditum]
MSVGGWRLARTFQWLLLLTVVLLLFSYFDLPVLPETPSNSHSVRRFAPQRLPDYECPHRGPGAGDGAPRFRSSAGNFTEGAKALLLVDSVSSRHVRVLSQFLQGVRVAFHVEPIGRGLPLLTFLGMGRFNVVIVDHYYKYINLAAETRRILDHYCIAFDVPVVAFLPSTSSNFTRLSVKGFPLRFRQRQRVRDLVFSERSPIPRIAKTGVILDAPVPDLPEWILFEKDRFHEVVLGARDVKGVERAVVVRDLGRFDGVERIVFGHNITHWMVRMALLDTMCYVAGHSHQLAACDPLRHVQIDIDDVFVGQSGVRMLRSDVEALERTQEELRSHVRNFTFTLGFSGFYFRNGDDDEDKGDELLVEWARKFFWFPHMWRHNHVQEHNFTFLEAIMTQNKLFAQSMKLPLLSGYAISPQHTGVYPVYPALFEAWKRVWRVNVTSTEQYPHFFHSSQRRGFVHEGVAVLPRQTCGLYTHTYFFHSYPGGLATLLQTVFGGDLATSILLGKFSIFMTHQQNFANDRLGAFVFRNVFAFLHCWTNLSFQWIEPQEAAARYFRQYPSERKIVWTNACEDPKHQKILPPHFNCSRTRFPDVVIVGPQKTGTTALATFLSLHPNVSTNVAIEDSFEELQFFGGGPHYARGPAWYAEQFKANAGAAVDVVFEKTANYFDSAFAPRAVSALLPATRIVVLLLDPSDRAYSWYQHLRAHNDSVASRLSLAEIFDAAPGSDAFRVRQRCFTAGRYAHHLLRWLDFFPAEQLLLLDADRLRLDPGALLNDLSERLGLPPVVDFQRLLRYDAAKRFFCIFEEGKPKRCLGRGKGRSYPDMDGDTRAKLDRIYREDNEELRTLLTHLRVSIPVWLQQKSGPS